ncbi:MAG: hypothetical protein KC561_09900, partial [Myxococcales bacterium]|nr:hypothetical protein [Myxococcales bacterium]
QSSFEGNGDRTLRDATIPGGWARGDLRTVGGGAIDIRSSEKLQIEDSIFVRNFAPTGGAIRANHTDVEISGTSFEMNYAHLGGTLAVDGPLLQNFNRFVNEVSMFDTYFRANGAGYQGGAIHSLVPVQVIGSLFANNGVYADPNPDYMTLDSGGGAIFAFKVEVHSSAFIENVVIDDPSASYPHIFDAENPASMAFYSGGAIMLDTFFEPLFDPDYRTSTITESNFEGNVILLQGEEPAEGRIIARGGAVAGSLEDSLPAPLEVSQTTFSENVIVAFDRSFGSGGALALSAGTLQEVGFTENEAENGAGLACANCGTVSVFDSAFVDNQAAGEGAAIHVDWYDFFPQRNPKDVERPLTVENVTFSENVGTFGVIAQSITSRRAGELDLAPMVEFSTFYRNTSSDSGLLHVDEEVNEDAGIIRANIFEGNLEECGVRALSRGYNITDAKAFCFEPARTDQTDTVADLEVLADNGGFTPTHAIGEDSPAARSVDVAICPDFDQRGFLRPGVNCDAGSYESLVLYGGALPRF